MDTRTRKWVAAGLLVAVTGTVLLYAVGRLVPKLMRRMMRSMMEDMMGGEGGCNPPEM